jgi:hypothetical protein
VGIAVFSVFVMAALALLATALASISGTKREAAAAGS